MSMNISQRLRTCAKHTGLDAVIELLQEAADEIDALQARAQGHPAQAEVTDGVSLGERFRDWIVTIKDAHDNSLDGEHASSRSMLRGVIYEMEEACAILSLRPAAVPMTDEVFDLICNAIDKADTISMEGDYMLDSDDCIVVVRVMQALLSIHHGITVLRPVQVPMNKQDAWDNSPVNSDWEAVDAYLQGIEDAESHYGITAQAKKETP